MRNAPTLLGILALVCGVEAALVATIAGAEEGGWKAGAASVVITPDEYMPMAGYGSRGTRPAEGTISDLYAKALVLEDGDGKRVALVTLDLVGIDRGTTEQVCKTLKQRHSLSREQIALCTSHTHSGPVVGKTLAPMHYYLLEESQKRQVDRYTTHLVEQVAAVVGQAIERLAPSEIGWTSGTAGFAVNRRRNPEAQVEELRKEGKLLGPSDHDVPVLTVRDRAGKLSAVVFGYACHATVLSLFEWCADYPGFAQTELERRHEGCVALFWAGCGADQNPLPRRTVERARDYGLQLADAVDKAIAEGVKPLGGSIQASYQEIDLALGELPSRDEIESDAKSSNHFVASRAKSLLAKLEAGPLETAYPYPVQVWRLGEPIEWVFLGGEVVVDFAIRLKAERRDQRTWVAGYANDVMAYIPSRRVLTEGGYEGAGAMVYYGLPTAWAPEVEESIVAEVHRQAGK